MLVARAWMGFHRDWHASGAGRGRQFWSPADFESRDQTARGRPSSKSFEWVAARPEFVSDLRARLMMEALSNGSSPHRVPR